jgi:hypothetical protein
MPAAVAAAAAAASGGALLLYLLLTCRPQAAPESERGREEDETSPLLSGSGAARGRGAESGREEEPWPHREPVTCCEAAAVAARTARRTWELTVGRWGVHGLAFGIKRHMNRQVCEISPYDLVHSISERVMFSASPARVLFSFALLCYRLDQSMI